VVARVVSIAARIHVRTWTHQFRLVYWPKVLRSQILASVESEMVGVDQMGSCHYPFCHSVVDQTGCSFTML
jgi:hypothetical protein